MALKRMMTKDFLSQKEMAAIGSVVAESAQLEASLDWLILKLTKLSLAQYEIVVGSRMLGAKISLFKDLGLLKLKSKKRQKAFSKIMDKFSSLNAERVIVVHGLWRPAGGVTSAMLEEMMSGRLKAVDLPPGEAIHRKGRGKFLKVQSQRLNDLAKGFTEGMHDLTKFWEPKWYKERELALEKTKALRKANQATPT